MDCFEIVLNSDGGKYVDRKEGIAIEKCHHAEIFKDLLEEVLSNHEYKYIKGNYRSEKQLSIILKMHLWFQLSCICFPSSFSWFLFFALGSVHRFLAETVLLDLYVHCSVLFSQIALQRIQ